MSRRRDQLPFLHPRGKALRWWEGEVAAHTPTVLDVLLEPQSVPPPRLMHCPVLCVPFHPC